MSRAPSVLRRLWERWKRVSELVGNFQARVLLTVLYFVLLAPLAVPMRLLGDPLRRRPRGPSFWLPRPGRPVSVDGARRQY